VLTGARSRGPYLLDQGIGALRTNGGTVRQRHPSSLVEGIPHHPRNRQSLIRPAHSQGVGSLQDGRGPSVTGDRDLLPGADAVEDPGKGRSGLADSNTGRRQTFCT
jgi:hypothetical protein